MPCEHISHPLRRWFYLSSATMTNTIATGTSVSPTKNNHCLTVRFLVSGSGTGTSELLGLAPSVVGNEECSVVLHEGLLQLVLGVLIDVFLVVGNDGLGNGLSDGVDLRSVATTGNSDTDIDIGEFVEANNQDRLVDLKSANCVRILTFHRCSCHPHTLKRRISGWTKESGLPLTLMRPLPFLQWATAVAARKKVSISRPSLPQPRESKPYRSFSCRSTAHSEEPTS